MKDMRILDELNILTASQKVISELLGAANDSPISTRQLAILLGYLQERQERLIDKLGR